MKTITKAVTGILIFLAMLISLSACGKTPSSPIERIKKLPTGLSENAPQEAAVVVQLTINPQFAVYLDENAAVLQVRAMNADAETVLSNHSELLQMQDYQAALKGLLRGAFDEGFLSETQDEFLLEIFLPKNVQKLPNLLELSVQVGDAFASEKAINFNYGVNFPNRNTTPWQLHEGNASATSAPPPERDYIAPNPNDFSEETLADYDEVERDAEGYIVKLVSRQADRRIEEYYDRNGFYTKIIELNPNEKIEQTSFNAFGCPLTEIHTDLRDGKVMQVTNAYDAANRLIRTETVSDDFTRKTTYANGLLVSEVENGKDNDGKAYQKTVTYGANGQPTKTVIVNEWEKVETVSYNSEGCPLTEIHTDLRHGTVMQVTNTYDAANRLILSETVSDDFTSKTTYVNERPVSMVESGKDNDGKAYQKTVTYGANGQPTKTVIVNEREKIETVSYNSEGRPLTEIHTDLRDGKVMQVTKTYDAANRLIRTETVSDDFTSKTTYVNELPTSTVENGKDGNGNTYQRTVAYGANGEMTKETVTCSDHTATETIVDEHTVTRIKTLANGMIEGSICTNDENQQQLEAWWKHSHYEDHRYYRNGVLNRQVITDMLGNVSTADYDANGRISNYRLHPNPAGVSEKEGDGVYIMDSNRRILAWDGKSMSVQNGVATYYPSHTDFFPDGTCLVLQNKGNIIAVTFDSHPSFTHW